MVKNLWISLKYYINVIITSFVQVEFEAVRGSSFRGDTGLDDIRFTDGPCSKFTVFCVSSHDLEKI